MQNEVAGDKNKPRIIPVRNKLINLSSKWGTRFQVRKSMLKDAFFFYLNWKWNRIKTESTFPTIRRRLDGKFLHWTFCDDKTKCFPLHFGIYSMSKIDWRRFYSSGIASSFTGVDYLCASTVARWGENTQTFHLSPEECPQFACKDTFLMSNKRQTRQLSHSISSLIILIRAFYVYAFQRRKVNIVHTNCILLLKFSLWPWIYF